jgi:hypothetical protein
MASAGSSLPIVDVALTFDDAASGPLPDLSQITSGSYQVSQYGFATTLPGPAPSPAFGTNLSAFGGLDPNGTWNLWLVDLVDGAAGSLAGGWGLNIETVGTVPIPASALLLLTGLGTLLGVRRGRRR